MSADDTDRHHLFAQARTGGGWSVRQAWLGYFALGGRCDLIEVEAFLEGLATMPASEQDVLAAALNDRLLELYLTRRVPCLTIDPVASEPPPSPVQLLDQLLHRRHVDDQSG